MIFLCYLMIGFLAIVFSVTLFNAFTAPMLKNGPKNIHNTFVSILIPARNEGKNIKACLESLIAQNYPNFEILVLDDHSTDNTAEIVQTFTQNDHRIHCIKGKDLPGGWTGKNWACHQLSNNAKGDILIFTDADNRFSINSVSKTVGWIRKLNLDLFSTFPQQHALTLAEKLIIPSVYMTVYCYLPLWLTYSTPFPSLAAANGQWIAFTKKAYLKLGGHKAAKTQVVEDTWLARLAKKQKMKILTAAGTGAVYARMYHNWSEIWQGFSKNLFGLMGYNTLIFLFLVLLMLISYIFPYFLLFHNPFAIYAGIAVIINLVIRFILSYKYKDPLINIIFHPLAILITIIIGFNSIRISKHGNLVWKGRKIIVNPDETIKKRKF